MNCYKLCLFLLSKNVDFKIIIEIIEIHFAEVSGFANSCNEFVASRSWQTMKLPILLSKSTSCTFIKRHIKKQKTIIAAHTCVTWHTCKIRVKKKDKTPQQWKQKKKVGGFIELMPNMLLVGKKRLQPSHWVILLDSFVCFSI